MDRVVRVYFGAWYCDKAGSLLRIVFLREILWPLRKYPKVLKFYTKNFDS